jgi:hypothetical protein
MAVSGVARLQNGWPVAVFYPFGLPTPYAYDYRCLGRCVTHLLEVYEGVRRGVFKRQELFVSLFTMLEITITN